MQDKKLPDKELIDALKTMPVIIDNRSKQEIYAKVQAGLQKKKQKQWIMPLFSMAAVASLLIVLSPPLLEQMQNDHKSEETSEKVISFKPEKGLKEKAAGKVSFDSVANHVLTELPSGKKLLTFGVPDINGQIVIPISITVDKSENSVVEELYENAPLLPLDRLGLGEFTLIDYKLNMVDDLVTNESGQKIDNGDYVTITVPEDNNLNQGAWTLTLFNDSVNETFRRLNFSKVEYFTGKDRGIYFEQMAVPESGISVYPSQSKGYWLYQSDAEHPILLAPFSGEMLTEGVNNFESMLRQMQGDVMARGIKASIPADIVIEGVTEVKGDSNIVVKFQQGTILENSESHILMMNAIMMTAADFGFETVSFEGVENIDQVGWVKLRGKNPVPISPNPVELMAP